MSAAENAKSDGHQQHSKKFLYLFRFRHRKKSSSAGSISSPEERRRKLDHDMRTNWDELPATLRRRKEKLSQAVLDEFHSDDAVVYGEMTGDGGGTRVVVRADVNAEDAGEVSSIALSEDSLERGHRRNGSLKKLSEVLGPVEGQELSLGELKKLKEGLQEVLQTGIEPKQPEESRDNFEKEERHVIRLLSRAVSEDSLLIVSSGDEEQSSESEDDADDGGRSRQDSGTDVNTPSNCSSCGEEISSVVYEESRISSDDTSVDKRSTDDSSVGNSSGVDVHYSTPSVQNKKCEGNTGLSKHAASEEKSVENEETVKVSVDRQIADSYENSSVDPLYEKVLVTDKADTSPETAGKKTGEVGAVGRPTEDDSGWETCRVSPAGSESCWGGSQSSESEFGPTYVSFGSPGRELYDRVHIPRVGAPWGRQARRPLDEAAAPPPRLMTTIAEEEVEEDPPCAHLSVRQILKKFEELGGRMCPAEGDPEEKSATLREIHETLRCLEEKVRHYESTVQLHQKGALVPRLTADNFQQGVTMKSTPVIDNWTGAGVRPHHGPPQHHHHASAGPVLQPHQSLPPEPAGHHDGKHSLLQFAMLHFRQSPEKFEMMKSADGSISGSLKVIESMKSKKNKGKKANKENDWTWKEQVSMVKFTPVPIEQSLLRLESMELSDLAVECFQAVMRYMGDYPMTPDITEVKCVYTILMHCHKHESLRDEVYCQLMKQTTNNKSSRPDSCQRGWRLFSIVAAYFVCSDTLKPYLFKYLETAAYDKRRAYHGTATVCLQNLRKTFKYGGRKNVPSVEEITAISAGRNSKRQIYRLPGGTERVVNTKSTTVVQDVIEEMCSIINVQSGHEMEEFSLYCIVEGDTFTMPLAREEYVLDVTTELHKNQQVFYLIFCRSVWHFPLRLDSPLYIEVVFNQIAPDYLEGLLLVMPGEQLEQDAIYDIAKIAALLHRAADMTHLPTMKETKFLLPKPALSVRDVKPPQWVNMVQGNWREVEGLQTIQAKAQVLDILSKWPLFGSSFFAVKRISDPKERSDHILALNRHGVHFIDLVTHETLIHYPYSEVISTRKVKSEDGTLFLDMKCGNLMQQRITRLQTDQAHEISRLIRQYITMEQRLRS